MGEPTETYSDALEAGLALVALACGVGRDAVCLLDAGTDHRDDDPHQVVVRLGDPGGAGGPDDLTRPALCVRIPTGALSARRRQNLAALARVLGALLGHQDRSADSLASDLEVAIAGPMSELGVAVRDLQRLSLAGDSERFADRIAAATTRLEEKTRGRRRGAAAHRRSTGHPPGDT